MVTATAVRQFGVSMVEADVVKEQLLRCSLNLTFF